MASDAELWVDSLSSAEYAEHLRRYHQLLGDTSPWEQRAEGSSHPQWRVCLWGAVRAAAKILAVDPRQLWSWLEDESILHGVRAAVIDAAQAALMDGAA